MRALCWYCKNLEATASKKQASGQIRKYLLFLQRCFKKNVALTF
jgi:phage FluMu protein Com